MANDFSTDFETFLAHTDEKAVFLQTLADYIRQHNLHSVLDIGAGNGSLSIPLAKLVDKYVAVESKPSYAARLADAGVSVIGEAFPVEIEGTFDLVLMSHVISYQDPDAYKRMILAAWERVAPGGRLLIVTHRGEPDHWSQFMDSIGLSITMHSETYQSMLSLLGELGEMNLRRVITTLDTATTGEMLPALAFVASNGRQEDREAFMERTPQIEGILNSKYKSEGGYVFPFTHLFLDTHKR